MKIYQLYRILMQAKSKEEFLQILQDNRIPEEEQNREGGLS